MSSLLPVAGLLGCAASTGPLSGLKGLAVPSFLLDRQSDADLNADFQWMSEAGVDWVRFDIFWNDVETSPTRLDWSGTDRIVAAARRYGLSLLAVVHTVARDVRPKGTASVTVPQGDTWIDRYAQFCAEAATRFRGRIAGWEVWNEPNLVRFWAPSPSPTVYARLLDATAAAIKSVDRSALVVSGGLGGAVEPHDVGAGDFLDGLLSASDLDHVDAVSLHPYPRLEHDGGFGELNQVAEAERLLRRHGQSARVLWGTETGAPSADQPGLSERVQAELVSSTYKQWSQLANRGPLFWYTLRDSPSPDDDYYGLFRADGTAKPAAGIFATLDHS